MVGPFKFHPVDYQYKFAEFDSVRDKIVNQAVAHFEHNRDPGVAYDSGSLVQRDGGYFIEWRPVGYIRTVNR